MHSQKLHQLFTVLTSGRRNHRGLKLQNASRSMKSLVDSSSSKISKISEIQNLCHKVLRDFLYRNTSIIKKHYVPSYCLEDRLVQLWHRRILQVFLWWDHPGKDRRQAITETGTLADWIILWTKPALAKVTRWLFHGQSSYLRYFCVILTMA